MRYTPQRHSKAKKGCHADISVSSSCPKKDKAPESPTTVKPLDYSDDEDNQESGVTNMDSTTTKPAAATATATATPTTAATTTAVSPPPPPPAAAIPQTTTTSTTTEATDEVPPPKPPRPVTEQQKNEAILKEAFPSIEASVIKAVLIASGGRIDPAFNALLGMSDPDAVQHNAEDEVPPPQPPRPQHQQHTAQSQLEADEAYARQLAEHYESSAYEARTSNRGYPPAQPRRRQQTGLKPNELYDDREHSFIDDDLPVIQEQLKKGFQETQVKVNSWFKDLKKKFDEQFDEDGGPSSSAQQQQHGSQYGGGRPMRDASRRERDYERYDADPELLSDDFAGMKFHSDGSRFNKFTIYFRIIGLINGYLGLLTTAQHQLGRTNQTPTSSGLHHRRLPPSQAMVAKLPSRRVPRRLTSTAPRQRIRPGTQLRQARRASGSLYPTSTPTPLQTMTILALVTAMTKRTSRPARAGSRWTIRRRGCERQRQRPCRTVLWMTRPRRTKQSRRIGLLNKS